MSDSPYYCFFPGDYVRDTIHLGWFEDLAYRRLLDRYYSTRKPIPNDRGLIMRLVRANEPEQQSAVDVVLSEFFELRVDGWHQKKADEELAYSEEKRLKAKQSAKRRWDKEKDMRTHCERIANALRTQDSSNAPTPTPTPTPHPILNTASADITNNLDICRAEEKAPDVSSLNSKKESIKNLRAHAVKVLEQLNRATGREFQAVPANVDMIVARLNEGATLREIRFVVTKKCHDWKDDEKMSQYLRPATLFNKTKFAQYRGEINFKEIDNAE